jgi:hypothetical protein
MLIFAQQVKRVADIGIRRYPYKVTINYQRGSQERRLVKVNPYEL